MHGCERRIGAYMVTKSEVVTHFEKTELKTDVMPAEAGIQSQLHGFRLSPE